MPSSIAIAAVHHDDNSSSSNSALPPIRRKRPHDPDPDSDLDPDPERHSPVRRRYADTNAEADAGRRADDTDGSGSRASTAHGDGDGDGDGDHHHDNDTGRTATPANAASMRLQNLTNENEDAERKSAAGNASKSLSYPLPDYANKQHLRDDDNNHDHDNSDRDDNMDIDIDTVPNAARGMSLPPLARFPRRADTTNTTISAYDVDPSNPSAAASSSSHLPNLKKYSCDHCGTQFTRHHNLKSHLLTHSEEKPHTCDVCGQRFRRRHDMKRHMKLHTGERPHICVRCGRKFARGDALARHAKGPGGCAGRRESGGSSLGLGDPGDFLSAGSMHATDKGRSLSTSSVANHNALLRDDNGDHVTVTVSNATADDCESKAGSRGDPRERLIYTEPDLMDEEDEQNTPLRIRRGGDDDHHHHNHHRSADHRSHRQHAGLQHKHPTAPDTHHLHPSSAYDHYNRHARRSPHDPYTYPMAAASSATSQESSDCVSHTAASSTRPVMPATLLPSPVSRANSGNSNDAASEVLVGTAAPPTTTLPPAVSISESPKSMSPNFQRHKYESAMQHIDSRNLSAHAQQRSASPQLIYPHSRLMHSPTYLRHTDQPHRPASPNSTNVSSISQLHAQTEPQQPTGSSIPLDQSSAEFKGRTPSLKPRYHAALSALPQPQPSSQQQQISPRQLPIPAGMPTGQSSYLHLSASTHGEIRHNGHGHQVSRSHQPAPRTYMHAQQRRGQGHRHSASSCGSLGSGYRPTTTNPPNDEGSGSQLTLSPPRHHRASYSHSRSQSVSRPPSHSQPQPQSASRPHFSPMPTSVSQHSSTSGAGGQLLPPASSVTASPPSGITPLTTTGGPGPVMNNAISMSASASSNTTLPPFNPIQNSYLQPLPPPRPQRTLSATSAISNPPVGSAPLISKAQLTLPHPEGWAYVQSLEDRIASLEAELKEIRAHVFANGRLMQVIPPPPLPPPPPPQPSMATPATTTTATAVTTTGTVATAITSGTGTGTGAAATSATNTESETNA